MKNRAANHLGLFFIVMLPLLTGCSSLLSNQPLQTTTYYSLEVIESNAKAAPVLNVDNRLPTIVVDTPKAAAGFDTRRMMYTRHPHQLEYFARNEWVDTPAHMLQTLIISTIEQTGDFNAVLAKYSVVKSGFRLESEIVRLLQIFNDKPSQVQFTLRATIIESATGKVIAQREFDERIQASTDDPVAGVVAANKAVNRVLTNLSAFSHEAVITWRKSLGAN